MIQLGPEELEKLSAITGMVPYQIKKLQSMRLLSEQAAIDALIMYDFKRTRRRGAHTSVDIIEKLAEKYDVKTSYVRTRVYISKAKAKKYCKECGKEILAFNKGRGGKCKSCTLKEIKLAGSE